MRPKMKPMTADELREEAKAHGADYAYNILLLGGYEAFAGTKEEYDELLKELESMFYWGHNDWQPKQDGGQ